MKSIIYVDISELELTRSKIFELTSSLADYDVLFTYKGLDRIQFEFLPSKTPMLRVRQRANLVVQFSPDGGFATVKNRWGGNVQISDDDWLSDIIHSIRRRYLSFESNKLNRPQVESSFNPIMQAFEIETVATDDTPDTRHIATIHHDRDVDTFIQLWNSNNS